MKTPHLDPGHQFRALWLVFTACLLTPPTGGAEAREFENSLGLRFVSVPETAVLFSVWETRTDDYALFVGETKRPWRRPAFEQGPDHPAVNVSWEDAQAFCRWLTDRERGTGKLGTDQAYRLPTDSEWSMAVGLHERFWTPRQLSFQIRDVYPWGTAWPPEKGTGNFNLIEAKDCFPQTAPVGWFPVHPSGLRDLEGNVSEWCDDWYDEKCVKRVIRGASWSDRMKARMYSSARACASPNIYRDDIGFRLVLAPVARPGDLNATDTWHNSLGMGFIRSSEIDGALISRHETTAGQWQVHVDEQLRKDWDKPTSRELLLPVVDITWEEANAFCSWLTEKERKAGIIDPSDRYRLPSREEWNRLFPLQFTFGKAGSRRSWTRDGLTEARPNLGQWLAFPEGQPHPKRPVGLGTICLPRVASDKLVQPAPALAPAPGRPRPMADSGAAVICEFLAVVFTSGLILLDDDFRNHVSRPQSKTISSEQWAQFRADDRARRIVNANAIRAWQADNRARQEELYREQVLHAVKGLQNFEYPGERRSRAIGFRCVLEPGVH